MTDKELRKLKRADLLEILYYLQKEIEELNKENAMLKTQLENSKPEFSENEIKRIIKAVKSATRDTIREVANIKQNEETDTVQINPDNQPQKEVKHKHEKGKNRKNTQ